MFAVRAWFTVAGIPTAFDLSLATSSTLKDTL